VSDAYDMGIKAAELLIGSCQDIANLGEEFEELENDAAFCDGLDERAFCCTGCGWWFEQPAEESSDTGEWVCEECV
jgi:hypothetical protein